MRQIVKNFDVLDPQRGTPKNAIAEKTLAAAALGREGAVAPSHQKEWPRL